MPKSSKAKKKKCYCEKDVERAFSIAGEKAEDFWTVRRNAANVEVWRTTKEKDYFEGLYWFTCKCGNDGLIEYLRERYPEVHRQVKSRVGVYK